MIRTILRKTLKPGGLACLLDLLSSETNPFFTDSAIADRSDAVLRLLRRATAGHPDETLPQAYFRRSLDIIEHPDRFLSLLIVAPGLSRAGKRRWRYAERLFGGREDLFGGREDLFGLVLTFHDWHTSMKPAEALEQAFSHNPGRRYLGVNTYEGIEWYNRERFGDFVFRMYACGLVDLYAGTPTGNQAESEDLLFGVIGQWVDARHASLYQVEKLLRYISKTKSPTAASSSVSDIS